MAQTSSFSAKHGTHDKLAALTAKQISYKVRGGLKTQSSVIIDDPGHGAGFLAPLNEALAKWNLYAEFCWDDGNKVRRLKVMRPGRAIIKQIAGIIIPIGIFLLLLALLFLFILPTG
jgi:hypothetical protein